MATRSLDEHLEHLPLFPLPDAVLFPGMRLPLHIFEPRYRQMVADARARSLPIAIGHILGTSEAPDGLTAVHPIAGVGFIDSLEELPDGRYLIELEGVARVRILSERGTDRLYRVVRAERAESHPASTEATEQSFSTVRRLILAIHQSKPRVATALSAAIQNCSTLDEAADALAAIVQTDPLVRQAWLDELHPERRMASIEQTLESFLLEARRPGSSTN